MGRVLFVLLFLICFFPLELFASVGFFSLLPNPSGDDTLGEYIEIRNTGCMDIDLQGYGITDASGKKYVFPSGQMIASHTTVRLEYATTKIPLNNSGDESVTLRDGSGNIVDSKQYSGTQKDDVVISYSLVDDICSVIPPDTGSGGSTGTGSTGTGSTGTGSTGTGSTGTGSTGTGSTGTGSTGTGSTGTGSTGTGSTGTGSTGTGSTGTGTSSGLISGTGTIGSGNTGTGFTGSGGSVGIGSVGTGSVGTGSVGTGSVNTGSGISGTGGSTGSGMTTSGSVSSPPFLLLSLQYDDTDGNRKIDTLIIEYSLELSGSIDVNTLGIFSRSGGLATTKIDTATGYVQSAVFSGRYLILRIVEQDLEKDILHITNTTSSDLRLKTLGNMRFTSTYGQTPPDFFLTSSFSNYQNVSRIGLNNSGTGGVSVSQTGNITDSGIFLFPEIIPTLQSPTNATLSGTIFLCNRANIDCRVNLTLDPIFTGGFLSRDYLCNISTGGLLLSTCNPGTLYFRSDGSITLILREKAHTGNLVEKLYAVQFIGTPVSSSAQSVSILDMNPPVIILELDKLTKDHYEQINDSEFNCYMLTCSVNLTAERSYDPEGSKLQFLWMYDMQNITSNSRDPGTHTFSLGDHEIWLRVIDASGNFSSIRYKIHVLGPRQKEDAFPSEKKKKASSQKKVVLSENISLQKTVIKKINMAFFSPPEIFLQGQTEIGGDNTFRCHTTKTTCQINLTITGSSSEYQYEWILSDGSVYRGKNPKSWKLPLGRYTFELKVYKKSEKVPYFTRLYSLIAEKSLRVKHIKKITHKKSKKQKKIIRLSLIPEVHATETTATSSDDGGNTSLYFLFGLFGVIFFSRRMIGEKLEPQRAHV